jgi:ribonuclease HI
LLSTYKKVNPRRVEMICAVRHELRWKPQVNSDIPEDKDEAKRRIEEDNATIKIFTDGSGFENGVGAAAILYKHGRRKRSLKLHLGSANKQVVYGGEAAALSLAARLVNDKQSCVHEVMIGTDNQAAIRATETHDPTAGHYLTDIFHSELTKARRKHGNFRCTIRWTPGHYEIEGNEEADEAAKAAARGESSCDAHLPPAF